MNFVFRGPSAGWAFMSRNSMVPSEFFQLVLGCPLARPGAQEHCFEVSGGKRVPNDQTEKNLLGYIGNAEIPRTQVGVFGGCLGVVSGRLLFRSAQGPESLLYIYIYPIGIMIKILILRIMIMLRLIPSLYWFLLAYYYHSCYRYYYRSPPPRYICP